VIHAQGCKAFVPVRKAHSFTSDIQLFLQGQRVGAIRIVRSFVKPTPTFQTLIQVAKHRRLWH
jgi:hypothetical protein